MRTPVRMALFLGLACGGVGCAETSTPVAAYSVPHHARLWQQFCEQAWNVPQASALVAARGADGWELVAMYNGVLCYKRPAADPGRDPREVRPQLGPTAPQSYVPIVRDPGF